MKLGLPSGTQRPAANTGSVSGAPVILSPLSPFSSPRSPWIFRAVVRSLGVFCALRWTFCLRFWSWQRCRTSGRFVFPVFSLNCRWHAWNASLGQVPWGGTPTSRHVGKVGRRFFSLDTWVWLLASCWGEFDLYSVCTFYCILAQTQLN